MDGPDCSDDKMQGRTFSYCDTQRYRTFEDWERDELINNLVGALKQCSRDCQEQMVWHFTQCDPDYGRRVAEGIGLPVPESSAQAVPAR